MPAKLNDGVGIGTAVNATMDLSVSCRPVVVDGRRLSSSPSSLTVFSGIFASSGGRDNGGRRTIESTLDETANAFALMDIGWFGCLGTCLLSTFWIESNAAAKTENKTKTKTRLCIRLDH